MSIIHLPLELKGAILDQLSEDKAQLLRLRLVSKDFHDLATPRAFHTLNISRKKGCYAAFSGMTDESPTYVHVKEINFRALEKMHDPYEGDTQEETISIFPQLTKFSSLRTLHLYFPDEYEERLYEFLGVDMSPTRTLQIKIFKIFAGLSPDNWGSLRELEVHGLLPLPNEGLRLEGLLPFFRRLAGLHISLVTSNDEDFDMADEDYSAFWAIDLVGILSVTSSIAKFTLISDSNTTGFLNADWDNINLPKLEYLRLDGIVFTNITYHQQRFPSLSNGGVEEFILRHKNTLEDLDLSSCSIEIADEDPNPRTWATIWKNVETNLTRLQSFKFDPLPGRAPGAGDSECFEGYVSFLIESGYINCFEEDPADAEQDRMAFESLQRCIENRDKVQRRWEKSIEETA